MASQSTPLLLAQEECSSVETGQRRPIVAQRPDHASPFKLIEIAPGVTADEVAAKTTAKYEVAV